MIAITAATGQLGRLVVQNLLQKLPAGQLVAAVRDPRKAAGLAARGVLVREADYDRPATLQPAFAGVEKLLLVSSPTVGSRVPQHQAVIEAARRAGVQLIAYTSILHADRSDIGLAREHRETEAALAAGGVPHVLLRNGWYVENYLMALPAILQHHTLMGSAGSGRISCAGRADYAAAAAAVLGADTPQAGRIYELAGSTTYTLAQLAAEISRQSGKAVAYQDMPQADYQAALQRMGLPEGVAHMLADSDAAASRGALFGDEPDLERLIGRPATTVEQAVAQALMA